MNVEGGTLLIGVADNGTVLGVEYDLDHKPQQMQANDRDKYEQLFQSKLLQYLDAEFSPYIHLTFHNQPDHTVVRAEIERSPKPVYLKDRRFLGRSR
jgi:hypothetical protein